MNTTDAHNCADHAVSEYVTVWENGQKKTVLVQVCSICGAPILGGNMTVR